MTKKLAQVDDYHGIKVDDPYRWLEDLEAEETKAWIAAQNKLTGNMTDREAATQPTIQTLLERIEALSVGMNKRFDEVDKRFAELDIRLDRIESVAYSTRGEFVEMPADFREFRAHLKEPA